MEQKRILVLDFGGQYAHLIARRVRELGVRADIAPPNAPTETLSHACGLILSGGPGTVTEADAPPYNPEIFKVGLPVLGICYGMQVMAHELGGKVASGKIKEYGTAQLTVLEKKGLFQGLNDTEQIWMSHGDEVKAIPEGFEAIGKTSDCPYAAFADSSRNFYGIQFHVEVVHTPKGMKVLKSFVHDICKCPQEWDAAHQEQDILKHIKEVAGKRTVVCFASGGVDSSVALALLSKALPAKQIIALHVDTGMMRKNESAEVAKALEQASGHELQVLDAAEEFFSRLNGVTDAEQKREIIGKAFVDVKREALEKQGVPGNYVLCQGTIYPDTIETKGTQHADKIKTHHNRVLEIMKLQEQGRLLEPLKELYKDEVRALGRTLGLPEELVKRHPFPGPGLGVRLLCSEKAQTVEAGTAPEKAKELLQETGYKGTMLPLLSVGVQGDNRTYRHPLLLEGKLDWKRLERLSTDLTNRVQDINRCVYALGGGPVETLEVEEAYCTRERAKVLREADAIVQEFIEKHGMQEAIWQFPVVLLPVNVNGRGEAVVLRPVESTEAMTARFYPMKAALARELSEQLMQVKGVGAVWYDVTHKPPGTIEWE